MLMVADQIGGGVGMRSQISETAELPGPFSRQALVAQAGPIVTGRQYRDAHLPAPCSDVTESVTPWMSGTQRRRSDGDRPDVAAVTVTVVAVGEDYH